MKKSIEQTLLLLLIISLNYSCKKDWLEKKPQLSLIVPTTISDYQSILDNSSGRTGGAVPFNAGQPSLGEIAAGDFYVLDASYNSAQTELERKAYLWNQDLYAGSPIQITEWNDSYNRIFYSNIVLEGIEKITPVDTKEISAWQDVKGGALFFRAINHYDLAQLFCKVFDKTSASTDLGIPLRVTADINAPIVRATVQKTYDQIIQDLKQSASLLPVNTPISNLYKLRPNKSAAYGMLARVYLAMENYDSALVYADASLSLYNKLLDYNSLSTTAANPVPRLNNEVLWHTTLGNYTIYSATRGLIPLSFYQTYTTNDLRKGIFFISAATITYKGSYNGSGVKFSGLATDEIYLIRAECYARKGNPISSMADLNTLLNSRWKSGTFISYTATDSNDALAKVLSERKKELIFRGTRWTDLRRLNKDSRFAISLQRTIGGQTYILAPNDTKYVLPIPPNVIQLSGIEQNK